MTRQDGYTGRFAPSPTGPLHFGSLVAALASFLDARHAGGRWLLRIEDLDPPRESPTAPAAIIRQLKACGLDHDGEVVYQSQRLDAYEAAMARLTQAGLTFPCYCSRTSVGAVYNGKCRHRRFDTAPGDYSVRIRVDDRTISFEDRICGHQESQLSKDTGDFIIRRRDGLFAYQLAVVVDDAWQGITHVVRGNDLLDSTPRQIYLCQCLGLAIMAYAHVPVIVDAGGNKLSKQTHAAPVDTRSPVQLVRRALQSLGQPTQDGIKRLDTLLARAIESWDPATIPRVPSLRFTGRDRQAT